MSTDLILRLGLLLLLAVVVWLAVMMGKFYVEGQRRRALAAKPLNMALETGTGETPTNSPSTIRVLSFSSTNCHQCKQLQAPALERLLEARLGAVTIIKVDATTDHDLVQTYRVMTVPSTVVLDIHGNAHAINYGFTNTNRLLSQVDEVLAKAASVQ